MEKQIESFQYKNNSIEAQAIQL